MRSISREICNVGANYFKEAVKREPGDEVPYVVNLADLLQDLGFVGDARGLRDRVLYLLQKGVIDRAKEMGWEAVPLTAFEIVLRNKQTKEV